jgi:hypothetical protein
VREFVHSSTIAYHQEEVGVVVSDGTHNWEERMQLMGTPVGRERDICLLLALGTLHVYAPDLLPLLEAPLQKETREKELLAGVPLTRMIQETVLLPVFLPIKFLHEDRQCQYQMYDISSSAWRRCEQEWSGNAEACYPDPCPGCGGYYCEQHLSSVTYTFTTTREEWRIYGGYRISRKVCLACALLPEQSVRLLRKTRLSINGEQEF